MSSINKKSDKIQSMPVTHEGGQAKRISTIASLRRSVLSCMLWESEFYENGESIADRIISLTRNPAISGDELVALAREARHEFKLRHVPLLILTAMMSRDDKGTKEPLSDVIADVISRVDEMPELLNLYWKINGRGETTKIANQLQKGLALAMHKFDAYQFAKYNRDGPVKLRDVLFMSHAKPINPAQEELFGQIASNKLPVPDTWETALSGGDDPKETFTRLLEEGRLGYMALLRNLRKMTEAGVDEKLVKTALLDGKGAKRVLPFRYLSAARAAPKFERELDRAMLKSIGDLPELPGKTIVLVDVSGSMIWHNVSKHSDLTRLDAAAALGAMVTGNVQLFSFSNDLMEVPPRLGMAGIEAIINSQFHGGTELGNAIRKINKIPHDRLIVVTDEQTSDRVPDPVAPQAYMINVASSRNGVGYHKWRHIDGFSENVLRWVYETEQENGFVPQTVPDPTPESEPEDDGPSM